MPLTDGEAQAVIKQQQETKRKVIMIRMNRPRPGVVVLEAPQWDVSAMYQNQRIFDDGTTDFATAIRTFLDEVVAEFLPPGSLPVDVMITDPTWTTTVEED